MKVEISKEACAVLVLDLQQLFTSPTGPFENHSASGLIDSVNEFCSFAYQLGVPVIYSRYALADDLSDAGLLADNDVVKAGHFCDSAPLSQLDERLAIQPGAIHLQRNRPGAFWNGSLHQLLAGRGINTLLICGLSINNAISTTAREAFAHDIASIIIRECCGAAPFETDVDTYFEILNTWAAEVVTAETARQRLQN